MAMSVVERERVMDDTVLERESMKRVRFSVCSNRKPLRKREKGEIN